MAQGSGGKRNRAFETVEQMASTDSLTGIANRRRFDAVLEQEWLRAGREQTIYRC